MADKELLHIIAWNIRVAEVTEDGAQRSFDFYNKQNAKERMKTGWYLALRKAEAVLEALRKAGQR